MRADRLISIVMLLQTHERMTAEELAGELEVSQRTIYRDITALNIAGVPVYTERGPGGGIALVESYRTTLTGISEDEARALFMLSIPQALVELGVGQKLKTALLKLSAALPHDQRGVVIQTQQRIYLDPTTWTSIEQASIHLGVIHQALWQDRMLRIVYEGSFNTHIELVTAPLGLVSKLNLWYLMGETEGYLRVVRVKDIIEVDIMEEEFQRDENFNLVNAWMEWCRVYEGRRPIFSVKVKISAQLVNQLSMYLGESGRYEILETDSHVESDWTVATIFYENFFRARESILSMGRAVEVLEPEALKLSVIDFAMQIVDYYLEKSSVSNEKPVRH
jgi:predicted DNA-binding transcriptional regulator YafY